MIGVSGAAALLLWALASQEPYVLNTKVEAAPPMDCSAAEHRQFDFWVGDWDVFDPQGKVAGTNSITKELQGCMLQEHWRSVDGRQVGTSLNHYEAATKTWHQAWVDSTAGFLLLRGSLQGSKMVLSGDRVSLAGERIADRISWEALDAGGRRVRQLWESSRDGGTTWTVAFDGTYVRKK